MQIKIPINLLVSNVRGMQANKIIYCDVQGCTMQDIQSRTCQFIIAAHVNIYNVNQKQPIFDYTNGSWI